MPFEITPAIVRALRPDISEAAAAVTSSRWRKGVKLRPETAMAIGMAHELAERTGEDVVAVIERHRR